MEAKPERLSDLPAKDVSGHDGFCAQSLLDLTEKDVTVRLLKIRPGGVGPVPPHSHAEAHFFLVLEGNLKLEIDRSSILVPSGSFIKVPPYAQHQLECSGGSDLTVFAIKWK